MGHSRFARVRGRLVPRKAQDARLRLLRTDAGDEWLIALIRSRHGVGIASSSAVSNEPNQDHH